MLRKKFVVFTMLVANNFGLMWKVWVWFGEAFRKRPHLVANIITDQLVVLIIYVKYCNVL